jgi:hypothetical protein
LTAFQLSSVRSGVKRSPRVRQRILAANKSRSAVVAHMAAGPNATDFGNVRGDANE